MDKVLTRKLFRDKYFQKHKPKTFNKGGLAGIQKFQTGGLSSKEKAILTLPFALEMPHILVFDFCWRTIPSEKRSISFRSEDFSMEQEVRNIISISFRYFMDIIFL